jgi:hypothetical protein
MKNVVQWMLALAVSLALRSVCAAAYVPVTLHEDFSGNPATNGWKVFGQTNLFAWNATNQNLEVTWDSSQPNSYFYKPLGTTFGRNDDFLLYFDLRMRDIAIGTTTNKPYTFQVAVGLLNSQQATNGNFLRGTGYDSPNIFEFDYFPDSGFGATISPTAISSNNDFATTFVLKEITTNDLFRVIVHMNEEDGQMQMTLFRNGEVYAQDVVVRFPTNFTDFAVDTVAIASYSDEGQFPDFAGSILAHGTVDNIYVVTEPVRLDIGFKGRFENGNWRMDFQTMPGWFYHVDRTSDFSAWSSVQAFLSTNAGPVTVIHSNPPATSPQFYNVWAQRLY